MQDREKEEPVADTRESQASRPAAMAPLPSSGAVAPRAEGLARLDLSARSRAVSQLQRSAGNAATQGLLAGRSGRPEKAALLRDSQTLTNTAGLGEDQARSEEKEERENRTEPPIQKVSNVTDAREARVLAERIESWRPLMQEGAGASGAFRVSPDYVTPAKMAANEHVISMLDDYLIQAGEQSRTLGSFQDSLQKARIDYERLNAQAVHLTVSNTIAGGSAADIGNQVVSAAGLGDPDAAQRKMKKAEVDPAMGSLHKQVQDAHDQMVALSQDVGTSQQDVTAAGYDYQSKLNSLATGVPTVNTNPDQAKEASEIKEQIEKVKQYIGKGLELAAKGAEAAGIEGADKAVAPLEKVGDFLTDEFYAPKLNDINTKVEQYNMAHEEHKITAMMDDIRAASTRFVKSVTVFNNTREKFEHSQKTYRTALQGLGRSADAGHGDKFAQVAAVLAEVDTYETQLDETLRLGLQEQTAAQMAASARREVGGGPGAAGAPRQEGQPYYEPYRWFHSNGDWSYQCTQQEVNLPAVLTRTGGSGVASTANAAVDDAVKELQGYRQGVDPMRQELAKALDLTMDNAMPSSAGGPGPPQRSANQGL
jgi:hypothetical protein